jgi:hypothetical protein
MENKMWVGIRPINRDFWFRVFDNNYEKVDVDGLHLKHIMACWFTNLNIEKHRKELKLRKTYNPNDYLVFDNYNAINVGRVVDIPKDYDGLMGVPITFMGKYNSEQFEIINADLIRKSESVPQKQHGLIKDKEGSVGGNTTYVRVVIRNKKPEKEV